MARVTSARDLLVELGHSPEQRLVWVGRGVAELTDDSPDVSDVNADLARKVVTALVVLDAQKDENITLLVDSGGGWEAHGYAIHDAIARCRSHVTAVVIGEACSMASVFVQAADYRIMMPNAWMMIHDGTYEMSALSPKDAELQMRLSRAWKDQCRELLNQKADIPERKLKTLLEKDSWFNAQETVKLGLADVVADRQLTWDRILAGGISSVGG